MIRYLIFPLFLLGSLSSAFSQVRGIVKDIAGEPIIGANVFWLGTTTGTTTGESGKFSLPETGTSDKLVVRFVGYRSDTIHIDRLGDCFTGRCGDGRGSSFGSTYGHYEDTGWDIESGHDFHGRAFSGRLL